VGSGQAAELSSLDLAAACGGRWPLLLLAVAGTCARPNNKAGASAGSTQMPSVDVRHACTSESLWKQQEPSESGPSALEAAESTTTDVFSRAALAATDSLEWGPTGTCGGA
jgi:hypothetical protein